MFPKVFASAILCILPQTGFSQHGTDKSTTNASMFRDWTESGDKARSIRARLIKVTPTHVVLLRESGGGEVPVRKTKLSKLDTIYAAIAPLVDSDRAQFDEISSVLSELKAGNYPKPETIQTIVNKHPKSPYGFMLMGITTINSDPDFEKAVPYFVKALKAVEERQALVTNLIPVTHMSCCINHAAAQWRVGSGALAAKSLQDTTRYMEIPALVLHNAKVIESESPYRIDKFRLTSKAQSALGEVLLKSSTRSARPLKESTLYFSLNLDAPPEVDQLEAMIKDQLQNAPNVGPFYLGTATYQELAASANCTYEPWCLACYGRGVMRCEGRCNRGLVSVPVRSAEGYNRINGQTLYAERYVDKPCPVCDGRGVGDRCRVCDGRGRK